MRSGFTGSLLATFLVCGCTGGDFQVKPLPASTAILRGKGTPVPIEISRLGGFHQGVSVTVSSAPFGIGSTPAQIGQTETTGTLSLSADSSFHPGATYTLQLDATGEHGPTHTVDLPIVIQDPGGQADSTYASAGRLELNAIAANTGLCGFGTDVLGQSLTVRIQNQFVLERRDKTGASVTDFGEMGSVFVAPAPSSFTGCGFAMDADSTALVAVTPGDSGTPFVARYLLTGVLQTNFGSQGRTNLPVANESVADLVIASNERVVVLTLTKTGMGLTRLTAFGQLDSSFGSGGRVSVSGQASGRPRLAPLSNGRVLLAADLVSSSSSSIVLSQFAADGSLDSTFGTQGVLTLNVPDVPQGLTPTLAAVKGLSNGSILVSVEVPPTGSSDGDAGRLIQLLPSGQPDPSFGTNGLMKIAPTPNAPGSTYGLRALAVLSDGRILGVGTVKAGTGHQLGLYRFLPSGAVDSAFGGGSPLLTSEHKQHDASGNLESEARGLSVLPDGRILIVGDIGPSGDSTLGMLLARFWP